MPTTKVVIGKMDAAEDQHEIIRQGAKLLEEIIALDAFAEAVKKGPYPGGMSMRTFDIVNGKRKYKTVTVDEKRVLQIIHTGEERKEPQDNIINMDILVKPQKKGVVGSAILGKQPIMPSTDFVRRCKDKDDGVSMARHLIHEWMHVAGFFHEGHGPDQKDVPYVVGDIVRNLAKSLDKVAFSAEVQPYANEDSYIAHVLDTSEDEMVQFEDNWEIVTTSSVG
jgi:hypothetical protein